MQQHGTAVAAIVADAPAAAAAAEMAAATAAVVDAYAPTIV